MPVDRRIALATGFGLAAATTVAGPRMANAKAVDGLTADALVLGSDADQSVLLQALIDAAATQRRPLVLPSGRFRVTGIWLRPGSKLYGAGQTTVLEFIGGNHFIAAERADGIVLQGLELDGAAKPISSEALLSLKSCSGLTLSQLTARHSTRHGFKLDDCSGSVSDCRISNIAETALHALDSAGLNIVHNEITLAGNNGIQVWRSSPSEDGTIVFGNRVSQIRADAGGSGENGNGINVFRANSVLVTGNRISDCAYSAVRGNAASNIQIIANSCSRLGEVAIYAEFGFEGALIANNLVNSAATGISVTNFNEGGRLAAVQGNLIRNLLRREHEPVDKRGHGITIEADAAVTGNVIEGAATAGLVIGWGRYLRDVAATGNTIRSSKTGILVSDDPNAGACLIANNLVSGATDGAIRAMRNGAPIGPDLALEAMRGTRISITANMAV